MTMNKDVFIFFVGLFAYIQSEPTSLETVWLKDVTTRFQTDKRTLSDLDLPNELTFQLRRGTDVLTLNLKRNLDINSNANAYFVRKLKDGQSILVKTRNLEKEDVAYYHDQENVAFMTVKCVKRSNEQCDRVINGNIRIGDSIYDLRPAENEVTSRKLLGVQDRLGKRYVLQDQSHIQRGNSVETKDKYRQQKQVYNVNVAVLIDPGIWELYSSMVQHLNPLARRGLVKRKITEAYSHIMKGVNLRFKEIKDPSISIRVFPSEFIFFETEDDFPHEFSNVMIYKGKKYIDLNDYHGDISMWDLENNKNSTPVSDVAILFTSYTLYIDSLNNTGIRGASFTEGVCEIYNRTLVIKAVDYVSTVWTATHELGHSLGANHDGERKAKSCKSEDLFIMTASMPQSYPGRPYSRNPWLFSNCSVAAFKETLKDKQCVTTRGIYYNKNEYKDIVKKNPGEVYTPNEQCHAIQGPKSVLCEGNTNMVATFLFEFKNQ